MNNTDNANNENNATPNPVNGEDILPPENVRLLGAMVYLEMQLVVATGENRRSVKAVLALVKAMMRHPRLFSSNSGSNGDGMAEVTAEELYDKLWHPILSPLFENSMIPIRFHIQRPVQRQEEHDRPMTDEERASASRVQVDLLVDHDLGAYNLAIMQITKDVEHATICESRTDIYAEAKAMTERLTTILPRDQAVAFVVQITGRSGNVVSFRKATQEITLVTPMELNLQLPADLISFGIFSETLRGLLYFRDKVNAIGHLVLERLSSSPSSH